VSLQLLLDGEVTQPERTSSCDSCLTHYRRALPRHKSRIRPGTDLAALGALLWHVFERLGRQGVHPQRGYGMDEVRIGGADVAADEVERVTGSPGRTAQASRPDVRKG